MYASACDVTGRCMHILHAWPYDIMQLLHGLCCFDFVSDIPYPIYFDKRVEQHTFVGNYFKYVDGSHTDQSVYYRHLIK